MLPFPPVNESDIKLRVIAGVSLLPLQAQVNPYFGLFWSVSHLILDRNMRSFFVEVLCEFGIELS